jgi:hypothetical protein
MLQEYLLENLHFYKQIKYDKQKWSRENQFTNEIFDIIRPRRVGVSWTPHICIQEVLRISCPEAHPLENRN